MPGLTSPKQNTADRYRIELNGKTIDYTVRYSPRARYVRLVIKPVTGLIVTVPRSYTIEKLPDILHTKSGWILKKLSEYGQVQPLLMKAELRSGDKVPYLGGYLMVELRAISGHHQCVGIEQDKLIVSPGAQNPHVIDAVRKWYLAQAELLIKEKVDKLSKSIGVTYSRLTIRGQKTLWGSCSRRGTLSFNWKLLMAPEPVIEYVIIHELIHLKVMNHGKTFWKLVAVHCPEWREHKQWLRKHGFLLSYQLSL